MTDSRPLFPQFDIDSALAQVQSAEDARDTRDRRQVALACTEDSAWRSRDALVTGRCRAAWRGGVAIRSHDGAGRYPSLLETGVRPVPHGW
ncbi:DUF1348 family protein [Streptomyces sp. NPDC018347]|uniref:DUF1348 family protein n=1 Tax=Streptomyces sp. NPDC018347 TaxID=3157193 RepID=UPI0033CDE955